MYAIQHVHRPANAVLLVAAATAAMVSGCGDGGGFNPGAPASDSDKHAAIQKLMQRPSSEEAVGQYRMIDRQIREQVAKAVPALSGWYKGDDALGSGCGFEYPSVGFDGRTWGLENHVVNGPISEDEWAQALSVVAEIAAQHGFNGKPQILHDQPGQRDVVFHNVHDDGKISFSSFKNTVLQLSVGCHLPAETKKRYEQRPSTG